MAKIYDLHSHTTFSDGELSPESLIEQAKLAGVDVLALTDHDTIAGLSRAKTKADELGLTLVPGTEISVGWTSKEIHVVGLGVDPENQRLIAGLDQQLAARDNRAHRIGASLERAGIKGAYDGAKAIAHSELVARPHFAKFLVDKGYAKDINDAFKKFLTPSKPGYVETEWVDLAGAIDWIRQAGGVAVLAHPARYKLSVGRLRQLITDFKQLGGEAIEVVTSNHNSMEIDSMAKLCAEFDLLASAGSDFHGPNTRGQLGIMPAMPTELTPVWTRLAL